MSSTFIWDWHFCYITTLNHLLLLCESLGHCESMFVAESLIGPVFFEDLKCDAKVTRGGPPAASTVYLAGLSKHFPFTNLWTYPLIFHFHSLSTLLLAAQLPNQHTVLPKWSTTQSSATQLALLSTTDVFFCFSPLQPSVCPLCHAGA